jgi:hypothetical protein
LVPIVGLTGFIYVRSMVFESAIKFLSGSRLVFGSLLFIADMMGDLSLQESEPQAIIGSDADQFPPTPVRVSLACEARPEHKSNKLAESKSDLFGDTVSHHDIYCPITADPIYKPLWESDSDDNREIFMVGQSEPSSTKPKKRSPEQVKQKLPERRGWLAKRTRRPEKDTLHHETGAMAPGTQMRKLGMVPPLGDITPTSIDVA